jgi:hypothetical protein
MGSIHFGRRGFPAQTGTTAEDNLSEVLGRSSQGQGQLNRAAAAVAVDETLQR